eukprot:282516_1
MTESKEIISDDVLEDIEEEFATSWSDPNWLQTYQLHHNTVYDYFQNCPFYDNQCNNNIVLQQQMGFTNFEQQLANMTGTEYKVDFETKKQNGQTNPIEYASYNVIYKYHRLSPKQIELQRIYYCPGVQTHPEFGSIFPMPSINMVFNNKMRNAVYHLNKAMKSLQSDQFNRMIIKNNKNKNKNKNKSKNKNNKKQ